MALVTRMFFGIVVDFGSGAQGDYAEQHYFRQTRGILEGARCFGLTLGRVYQFIS